jgi:hypothetical protein
MEAQSCSRMSVAVYQFMQLHIPEDKSSVITHYIYEVFLGNRKIFKIAE